MKNHLKIKMIMYKLASYLMYSIIYVIEWLIITESGIDHIEHTNFTS